MATLVYSDVDGVDRSFALGTEPVTVGRGAECAIRSDDPRVSRVHARFYVEQGALWIEDLGSSNGIFVGPNKVSRAPVPTGEIILVGSLLIRLLPASGTLPPPIGLHGTLASWLDMERKARAAVEEERDAFARRVGEMHHQLSTVVSARTLDPDGPELLRQRDEAEARAASFERALTTMQYELAQARHQIEMLQAEVRDRADWSSGDPGETSKMGAEVTRLQSALDEAERARSIAEHAHGEAMREAQAVRDELVAHKKAAAGEHEALRIELARARESRMMAETQAGVTAAEKLAEADLAIAGLQRELAELRAGRPRSPSVPDPRVQELSDRIAVLTARAEKAEKDFTSAQIRAQGSERNLAAANAATAKAEARVAQLEHKAGEADERVRVAELELAEARERVAALETRAGAADAPLQAAEARAAKLAAELAEMTSQFETRRDRMVELETAQAAAQAAAREMEARLAAARTAAGEQASKLAEADKRAAALQRKLDELARADAVVAGATARAATAEETARDAERRTDDAEKRASAADTMAKAMAKDVAEALRRAAEADTRARGISRDLADALRRAEQAEARNSAGVASVREVEARATAAEARVAELEKELATTLERAHTELDSKLDHLQKELGAKLDQSARELAAERSTSLSLVDRKTQLERELADARAQLPALQQRAETAEHKLGEAENEIDALQDRVDDLESGIAVAETAGKATLDEVRQALGTEQQGAAEARSRAAQASEQLEQLRGQLVELQGRLREADAAQTSSEAALRDARKRIAELEDTVAQQAGATDEERDRLTEALARAGDAERKIEALTARAEAADLAIGRAGALQRQLDEALTRLAWLEREAAPRNRDRAPSDPSEAVAADRIAAAETRAREAEVRARDSEARIADAEHRAELAREADARARDAETRLAEAGTEAERRIASAEARVTAAEQRAQAAEAGAQTLSHQLAQMQSQIALLEREVASADNVRSFAAETEREIASLQRDLRDSRAKLAQMTLERDRLASEVNDARGDADTTNPRGAKASYDPEATAQVNVAKYESLIVKTSELEQKLQQLERDDGELRRQLADAQERLRLATLDLPDDDSDATRTANQLPIAELAEHVSTLEESIDSLRANMRAASDETAMMDQTESVNTISSAVSQAAEHVERARAAIRALAASIGLS